MMGVFDRFYSKEKLVRKTIEIDENLYEKFVNSGSYERSL